MELSYQQSKAIDIINKRFKNAEMMTVIAGYAGTGKSTIIKYFIQQNNLMENTKFVTFTGKASLVLQRKGLPATTIHKLIYKAHKNYRTGKFYFTLKRCLEENIDLIIVDEVSMVSEKLLKDLMSFNIPIIALGDPGQLEPIGENNHLLENPDVFLSEIHRQGADNSIIRLSMMAREGKKIPCINNDNNVMVINKNDLSIDMLNWADQILCGRNATRKKINNEIRKEKGFNDILPQRGDKVICLKNYWDTLNDDCFPLINGTIGTVIDCNYGRNEGILGQKTFLDFQADYTKPLFDNLEIDSNIFNDNAPLSLNGKNRRIIYEFDYGYAITCHKSQGSEYNKVLVYEEILKRESHNKWLYTAITRAADKLVLVKK